MKLVCNVNIVYGNLKSETSQDYAQKPQRNCTFMNSASGQDANLTFYLCILYCRSSSIQTFPHHWKDSIKGDCRSTVVQYQWSVFGS
jgi:hypothetical protein